MDRKEFIKSACSGACMALSSGFLLSAVMAACKTPLGVVKATAKDGEIAIPLSAFDASGYKLVRVSNYNYDLAIQRQADGNYQVLVLMCTHANQPLTRTGNNYFCTLHGSQFDHSGKVTKGPAAKDMLLLPAHLSGENLTIKLNKNI